MIKQVVNLEKQGETYKVLSLTNRLDPEVGSVITEDEVKDLLLEARRISVNMNVNIK